LLKVVRRATRTPGPVLLPGLVRALFADYCAVAKSSGHSLTRSSPDASVVIRVASMDDTLYRGACYYSLRCLSWLADIRDRARGERVARDEAVSPILEEVKRRKGGRQGKFGQFGRGRIRRIE
jgi:hypothetical protein